MTAGAAAGGRSSVAHNSDIRKTSFNVLMDDINNDEENNVREAVSEVAKDKEESLEQLMAAAVVNPNSSTNDSEWATATSKNTKNKKPSGSGSSNRTINNPQQQQPSQLHQSQQQQQLRPPKEPVVLGVDSSLEFYDFPATFRTQDLKAALHGFGARYRLKWNNDTSCWFVFESEIERDRALTFVDEYISTKPEEEKFKVRIHIPTPQQQE